MCNGGSTRSSYGGIIAILKPVVNAGRPGLNKELSLGMKNCAEHGKTTATIDGLGAGVEFGKEVLIHRDGDLRTSTISESSILHRIALPKDVAAGISFSLNTSLDLNVGGDGIVGRRVSLIDNGEAIAEGIVGWN